MFGGKFMARMRSGDRVHVFEMLSDLQAIQFALRNKILQPFARDAPGASDAGKLRSAGEIGVAAGRGYLRAGFLNANSLKAHIQEIHQFLKDDPSNYLFGIAERKLMLCGRGLSGSN